MTGIIFTYKFNRKYFNVGDYIQSLAAKDNLERLGINKFKFINREKLSDFILNDNEICIHNGWFQHNVSSFIFLNRSIYVSFHLTNSLKKYIEDNTYLLQNLNNRDILTRDKETSDFLSKNSIDSKMGYCLTLTLKKRTAAKENKIIFVDCLYRRNYEPRSIYLTFKSFFTNLTKHFILFRLYGFDYLTAPKLKSTELNSKFKSEEKRFELAEEHLRLFSSANEVVTSRIHCALPSLGFGKKVTYIHDKYGLKDESRLNGLTDLFDVISLGSFRNPFIIKKTFILKKIHDITDIKNNLLKHIKNEYKILADKS